jgi:lysophospholipase L1-like esterase
MEFLQEKNQVKLNSMIKKYCQRVLVMGLLALFALSGSAQPFADEIAAFKKHDSLHTPPQNAIVFAGSSSFRKWTDVADYFPGYTIINRGFGGSTLPDVIRYADETILKYHPKEVVIYCGENDIASSDTVTPQMVLERFKTLFGIIRVNYPTIPVVLVCLKTSPTRQSMMARMDESNNLVRAFLKDQKKTVFVDVFHLMLDPHDGTPIKELFLEDQLHMTSKGYAIWQKAMQPYLLKN